MVKLNRFYLFTALTCVYAVFIFYLSSLSSLPGPSEHGFLYGLVHFLEDFGLKALMYPFYPAYLYPDKFAHVLLYLGFGLLLNRTLSSSKNGVLSEYAVPFAISIGTFYAVTDELHQTFVPYRTASSMDLLADFMGLLFAQFLILIYCYIKRCYKQRRKSIGVS
jgi:VanZ family protein